MFTIMIVALGIEGVAIILLSASIIRVNKANNILLKSLMRLDYAKDRIREDAEFNIHLIEDIKRGLVTWRYSASVNKRGPISAFYNNSESFNNGIITVCDQVLNKISPKDLFEEIDPESEEWKKGVDVR